MRCICSTLMIKHLPYIIDQARIKTIDTPIRNSSLEKKKKKTIEKSIKLCSKRLAQSNNAEIIKSHIYVYTCIYICMYKREKSVNQTHLTFLSKKFLLSYHLQLIKWKLV
ncbi:hypothetical protein PUN28_014129 [Cardiocondyla obscurior]|uniref:Uncharacterized protein n=1 Tax=Cardiocondyla obscurior TaxID=286306 RepID=A0AAW2EYJ4_9HYME